MTLQGATASPLTPHALWRWARKYKERNQCNPTVEEAMRRFRCGQDALSMAALRAKIVVQGRNDKIHKWELIAHGEGPFLSEEEERS